MRLDLQLRGEVRFEQLTDGHGREGPAPTISPLPSIDLTDARYGQKKNATRSERGVKPPNSLLQVENQLERLSQKDAVKCTIGKHIGLCQITDQAGVRMFGIELKHILLRDLGSTVALTIGVPRSHPKSRLIGVVVPNWPKSTAPSGGGHVPRARDSRPYSRLSRRRSVVRLTTNRASLRNLPVTAPATFSPFHCASCPALYQSFQLRCPARQALRCARVWPQCRSRTASTARSISPLSLDTLPPCHLYSAMISGCDAIG